VSQLCVRRVFPFRRWPTDRVGVRPPSRAEERTFSKIWREAIHLSRSPRKSISRVKVGCFLVITGISMSFPMTTWPRIACPSRCRSPWSVRKCFWNVKWYGKHVCHASHSSLWDRRVCVALESSCQPPRSWLAGFLPETLLCTRRAVLLMKVVDDAVSLLACREVASSRLRYARAQWPPKNE
jgi:hypothetical protein